MFFFLTPKLLMTLVFLQSKHSPTANTMDPSHCIPQTSMRFNHCHTVTLLFVLNGNNLLLFVDKSTFLIIHSSDIVFCTQA